MVDPLSPFMIRAYIAILMMSSIAISGSISVLRGAAYMPAEVSHAALGGAALGMLIEYLTDFSTDPYLFATIFAIATTMLAGYAGRRGGTEAIVASLAGSLTIGISIYAIVRYILPSEFRIMLDGYLVGDILLLSNIDIAILSMIVIVSMMLIILFYNEIVYTCFDPEGAETMGLNVKLFDFLIFFIIGIAGSVATRIVGSLMVYALVIAPAITANEISKSIKENFLLTMIITLIAGYLGLLISLMFNLPSSGSIAIVASSIYVLTMLIKRGILRPKV